MKIQSYLTPRLSRLRYLYKTLLRRVLSFARFNNDTDKSSTKFKQCNVRFCAKIKLCRNYNHRYWSTLIRIRKIINRISVDEFGGMCTNKSMRLQRQSSVKKNIFSILISYTVQRDGLAPFRAWNGHQ